MLSIKRVLRCGVGVEVEVVGLSDTVPEAR